MDLDRARAPAAARARDDAMGGRVDSRDVHRAVSTNEIDATNYSSRVGCARASGRGVTTTRARAIETDAMTSRRGRNGPGVTWGETGGTNDDE